MFDDILGKRQKKRVPSDNIWIKNPNSKPDKSESKSKTIIGGSSNASHTHSGSILGCNTGCDDCSCGDDEGCDDCDCNPTDDEKCDDCD